MTFAVMSPRRYERTKSALTCGLVHASYGYEAALGQFTELPLVSLRVFPQYSRAEWDGFLNEAPALLVVPIHRISYSSLQCHWLISQRRCMKACLEHLRRGQASRMPGSISLQSAVRARSCVGPAHRAGLVFSHYVLLYSSSPTLSFAHSPGPNVPGLLGRIPPPPSVQYFADGLSSLHKLRQRTEAKQHSPRCRER